MKRLIIGVLCCVAIASVSMLGGRVAQAQAAPTCGNAGPGYADAISLSYFPLFNHNWEAHFDANCGLQKTFYWWVNSASCANCTFTHWSAQHIGECSVLDGCDGNHIQVRYDFDVGCNVTRWYRLKTQWYDGSDTSAIYSGVTIC